MVSPVPADPQVANVPLPPAQFRAAVAVVLLLILVGALDQMTVSVAVPTIARTIGGFEHMAWVIASYMIASTVVTPLYGRFGDMYGRRQVLLVAIALFIAGSAACGAATSMPALLAARLVQGAGAGGLVALSQGVVADVVPLRDRGRYQGYVSMVWAAASVVGPVAGGVLTQYLSWRWIFGFDVAMGLVAWWLVQRSLRALPGGQGRQQVDWVGAVLLLATLVLLLLPITRLGQGARLLEPVNVGCLAAGAACGLLLWHHQRRVPAPMLPFRLLLDPVVIRGSVLLFNVFFVFVALCLLVPLRLQLVAGWSAAEAGLFLMWLTLSVPGAVYVGGRWLTRTGEVRPLQRVGPVLVIAGLLALAALDPAVAWQHAVALVVLGCGFGLQMPTNLLMVQNTVARSDLGTATALTVFFRALGGAVGIAVMSSIVFAVRSGAPDGAAGDRAFGAALLFGVAVTVVSLWLSLGVPRTQLHGPAQT